MIIIAGAGHRNRFLRGSPISRKAPLVGISPGRDPATRSRFPQISLGPGFPRIALPGRTKSISTIDADCCTAACISCFARLAIENDSSWIHRLSEFGHNRRVRQSSASSICSGSGPVAAARYPRPFPGYQFPPKRASQRPYCATMRLARRRVPRPVLSKLSDAGCPGCCPPI